MSDFDDDEDDDEYYDGFGFDDDDEDDDEDEFLNDMWDDGEEVVGDFIIQKSEETVQVSNDIDLQLDPLPIQVSDKFRESLRSKLTLEEMGEMIFTWHPKWTRRPKKENLFHFEISCETNRSNYCEIIEQKKSEILSHTSLKFCGITSITDD